MKLINCRKIYFLPVFLLFIALIVNAGFALESKSLIYLVKLEGAINPAKAKFIESAIEEAGKEGARAIVIQLDTPGGLDLSMRSIVKTIISSKVPVITYVSPSGARAASAGVLVTISSHVAAMTPGTNIGAAHPVGVGIGGGKEDKVMTKKVEQDAAAYFEDIAKLRKRNHQWARDAVIKSLSSSSEDALKLNVIDLIAKDLNELLNKVDGREVDVAGKMTKLHTKNYNVKEYNMGFRIKFLDTLSDPNIAYILMMLGIYGLFFEIANPGVVLPGVIGGICLILAFFSFQTLPVSYAGLLLIILSIILFIAEIKVVSHGVLAMGGVISFVIGSIFLFESEHPFFRVSYTVIGATTLTTILFFAFVIGLALKAQRAKPATGASALIGRVGMAKSAVSENGKVFVDGELWNACSNEPVSEGDKVVVESVDGLKIKVRKL